METIIRCESTRDSSRGRTSSDQTLCRLCGDVTTDFVEIFNDDGLKKKLDEKIASCLQIQVSVTDVLSTVVCLFCSNLLDDFYQFFERASQVQVSLEKIHELSSKVTEEENEEDNCTEDILIETSVIEHDKSSPTKEVKLNKSGYQSRISKALEGYTWACTMCDFEDIGSIDNLHEHYKLTHNGALPIYKCIHCERSYNRYRSFTKHFLLHEDPQTFECDLCGKSFNLKSSLISHGFVHTQDRPYSCSICKKKFKNSATLTVHKKSHLPEAIKKRFFCQICNKECATKKSLGNHEKIHTGTRNFMCEICGKAFVAPSSLIYHLKIHSTEKNYHCPTCGNAFRTERLLRKHSIVHTSSKPHYCTVCEKSFRERSTLIAHTRIHTGEMPYQCEHCDRKFRFAGNLTTHRRTHTGERPFHCEQCKRTFTNCANLNKHNRRVHNNHAD